jgi:RNA polymerase sigma-70 factor (ECF subfamily)
VNPTERGEATDAELVGAFQSDPDSARGRAAAEQLLGRYERKTYLWCHRMVRDHDLALDLAQQSLLRAWRGLPGFRSDSAFATWLFTIVRNRCRSALAPGRLTRDEGVDLESLADPAGDPVEEFARRQGETWLEQVMLDHLDESERAALWLRCVECVPNEEITRILHVPGSSGARGLLQTARRKLRVALEAARARRGEGHD